MTRGFRGAALFLGVAGMFFLPLPASADKIDDIRQALSEKKVSAAELEKKEQAIGSEMTELKEKLVDISKTLQESEETLSKTDQKLKDLRQQKESYLNGLSKDQRVMVELLSAAKKYSRTPVSGRLARSGSLDAARFRTILKSIIPDVQEQSAALSAQLADVNSIEEKIAAQMDAQAEESQKFDREQKSLSRLLEERGTLYRNTENQRLAHEKEIAALTKEAKNIEDLMEKIKTKADEEERTALQSHTKARKHSLSASLPAGILLPVQGTLETGFGEKNELGAESRGIVLQTRSGASVVTPLAGTVKFAGPFQNYKRILIVEHRNGYYSLISGLGRIDTVVGASLAAGEPVGMAETSAAPQIYYELRQDGKPVNPGKLLVAQKKQEKTKS